MYCVVVEKLDEQSKVFEKHYVYKNETFEACVKEAKRRKTRGDYSGNRYDKEDIVEDINSKNDKYGFLMTLDDDKDPATYLSIRVFLMANDTPSKPSV